MDNADIRVYSEINCLFQYFPDDYLEKVPQKILKIINDYTDKKYYFDVDVDKGLDQQNITEETKNMLVVLKYNYWSTEDEQKNIMNQIKKNTEIQEEELRERYNPDNLFKDVKTEKTEKNTEKIEMEEISLDSVKTKWYQKIFNKIKGFFKK